jgi:hypothetical protein
MIFTRPALQLLKEGSVSKVVVGIVEIDLAKEAAAQISERLPFPPDIAAQIPKRLALTSEQLDMFSKRAQINRRQDSWIFYPLGR